MGTTQLLPNEEHIEIVREDKRSITFQLTGEDITNDTLYFQAWDGYGGASTIAKKTNSTGEHSDPSNGETQFTLDPSDTSAAKTGSQTNWKYEVWRTPSGGSSPDDDELWFYGDLKIKPRAQDP